MPDTNLAAPLSRIQPTQDANARYLINAPLATAASLALYLGRPLLITGEPGTGKSTLADEVSRQLGWPLRQYQCKSTSEANDLLYTYAAMRRWDDSHRGQPKPAMAYVRYSALGSAIKDEGNAVVLVDDIDKAPRDFANDLLLEIGHRRFTVPELHGEIDDQGALVQSEFAAGETTQFMVVITSNAEQELPAPFLRRCVHHFVEFPQREMLVRIIDLHLELGGVSGSEAGARAQLSTQAIDCFMALRELPGLRKRPATDELITWVRALLARHTAPAELDFKHLARLPLLQALIKTPADWQLVHGL